MNSPAIGRSWCLLLAGLALAPCLARAQLDVLAGQTASSQVTRVFLWNLDSWDVLGLFPGMEPYADPEVIDALRRFNRTR